jgi:outer membrane immunogenic protein
MRSPLPTALVFCLLSSVHASANDFELAPGLDPARLDWSGFHAGLRAGYIYGSSGANSDGGAAGGVTLGYDWQFGDVVAGVTGGVTIADLEVSPQLKFDAIADVRGRFGYSFDKVLVFGTGGAALASGRGLSGETGWTAGGGINFATSKNVIWGMQYLKYRFDNLNNTGSSLEIDLIEGELTYKF